MTGPGGSAHTVIWESFLYGHHEAWTNDQSTTNFHLPQGNGQAQNHCTNILSNFVIRNSHIQIVIKETKLSMMDALYEDKENDIKK
jgi:hypothetical protein